MVMTENPGFFIVGCPRSGTRLLARLLDAHPLLCVGPSFHRVIECLAAGGKASVPLYEEWDAQEFAAARGINPDVRYVDARVLVNRYLNSFAAERGKAIAGHKVATYACEPLLHRFWPNSRFTNIYRDGRNVLCSVRQWRWVQIELQERLPSYASDPEATVAGWWRWNVARREIAGTRQDIKWLSVAYESLVACPEEVLRKICQFLDIDFCPGMLQFHERSASSASLNAGRNQHLPVTAGLRVWERDLENEEVGRFQAGAGEMLLRLGYRLAPARISERASARAESIAAVVERTLECEAVERGWGSMGM